ncbi:MAG: PIG-L family deacetylase [Parcubacteria group bacterium]|nr:PIG-L family deacetylase [Parcubacteria group bacterium]
MTKNLKTPKTALAVFAHPDDMDFSSSGTIAKWALRGAIITYLVCTDGSKGSEDPKITPRKLAAIRKKEQLEAAKILGVKDVIFLGHRDGELVVDMKLKEAIARVIRQKKPDLVITLDPTFLYSTKRGFVNHSDHRAAGQAAIDAVFPLARDRLNFPLHEKQGLVPHKTNILLLVSFDEPEHFEDITKTFAKKLKVLQAHKSQVGDADPSFAKRIRDRARQLGKKAGMSYAEGFKKIELL